MYIEDDHSYQQVVEKKAFGYDVSYSVSILSVHHHHQQSSQPRI